MTEMIKNNLDMESSSYRERMLEYLFLGELLKLSWLKYDASLEVSYPLVDRSGYDVALEANGIVRHVQLKTSTTTAKTSNQGIHTDLAKKPSGCVIWIRFDPKQMTLGPFGFFGNKPGEPLDLNDFKVKKRSTANTLGKKPLRPKIREIPKGKFQEIEDIPKLYIELFGNS